MFLRNVGNYLPDQVVRFRKTAVFKSPLQVYRIFLDELLVTQSPQEFLRLWNWKIKRPQLN